MLQQVIVGLIVLVAAWAVARKYLPVQVRRRMAGGMARVLRGVGLTRLAVWMEKELPAAASCGGGCGPCGGCGSGAGSDVGKNEFSISVEELRGKIRRG